MTAVVATQASATTVIPSPKSAKTNATLTSPAVVAKYAVERAKIAVQIRVFMNFLLLIAVVLISLAVKENVATLTSVRPAWITGANHAVENPTRYAVQIFYISLLIAAILIKPAVKEIVVTLITNVATYYAANQTNAV